MKKCDTDYIQYACTQPTKKRATNYCPPIPPQKKKEKKDKAIASRLKVTKNIHYEIK